MIFIAGLTILTFWECDFYCRVNDFSQQFGTLVVTSVVAPTGVLSSV